jgi:diketogulonate reductase-like aldo/keto reductase
VLRAGLSGAALALMGKPAMGQSLLRKPIPRSGELLPVVGLGTWQTFDVGTGSTERAPLKEVLREFVQRGGSVIDSSPMYGRSETAVGEIADELGLQQQLFVATKVWTRGRDAAIRQMEESFRRLRVKDLDLM